MESSLLSHGIDVLAANEVLLLTLDSSFCQLRPHRNVIPRCLRKENTFALLLQQSTSQSTSSLTPGLLPTARSGATTPPAASRFPERSTALAGTDTTGTRILYSHAQRIQSEHETVRLHATATTLLHEDVLSQPVNLVFTDFSLPTSPSRNTASFGNTLAEPSE